MKSNVRHSCIVFLLLCIVNNAVDCCYCWLLLVVTVVFLGAISIIIIDLIVHNYGKEKINNR